MTVRLATGGILTLVVAAGVTASCSSTNGTAPLDSGAPDAASSDGSHHDATSSCGASGQSCCERSSCDSGLLCVGGRCAPSRRDAGTDTAQPHDAGADTGIDGTVSDAARDSGAEGGRGDAGRDAGHETGAPDAGHDGGHDAGRDARADAGCAATEKLCSGSCVAIDNPAYGCGASSCTACAAPAQCMTLDACDTTTFTCTYGSASDGTSCDDGNACTQTDLCQSGSCVGGNPVVCAAEDQCHTVGTCDTSSGLCSNPQAANGAGCDAGACSSSDSCQSGVCTGTLCGSGICAASLSAFTGTSPTGWNYNGSAAYDGATNTVVLTDGLSTVEGGTVLYKDSIAADTFTVSFDFKMTTSAGQRADGIVFVLETNGPTAVMGAYGGFGVLGLTGYAVELDIFDSGTCDPGDGNHAGIDLLSPCSGNTGIPSPIATSGDLYTPVSAGDNGVGDIGDGQWRTAAVALGSGLLSVSITDPSTGNPVAVPSLQGVALPGFVSGTQYYFGFGGGSGSNGMASRQEIRNVAIVFGSRHCL